MVNALYNAGKEGFLGGTIDWDNDDIKTILVDTDDYTVDLVNHQDLADIPAGARVATSANMGSKTITAGVADAADVTFSSVTGDQSEALVIFKDTGTEATSTLIGYIDTATGLPVTPDGSDVTITWDGGANRIFAL